MPNPRSYAALWVVCLWPAVVSAADPAPPEFIRGDVNADRRYSIDDVVWILEYLFKAKEAGCLDALDVNDDGQVDVADPIVLLVFLFGAGRAIARPAYECGEDPTEDDLGCELYMPCGTPRQMVNTIGQELVYIKPGSFLMGSPLSERGRWISCSDELQHLVRLTCGFYIGATEITYAKYRMVMEDEPRADFNEDWSCDECPVVGLNWFRAMEFCRRLSEREGLKYRLPTEAEWEYCCRAGSTTRFWFGDALECDDGCGKCPQADPYMFCGGHRVQRRVAQDPPNPWGLYDMHNSALEWCHDWFGPYPRNPVVDPKGPQTGRDRVVRGNAVADRKLARSAYRWCENPATRGSFIGFRVVLEINCPDYGPRVARGE